MNRKHTRHGHLPSLICLISCAASLSLGSFGGRAAAQVRGAARVSIDTTNGVVITSNSAAGLWSEGEAWTVRQVFRLGAPDGPEEELFSGPLTSVSLGPHGQVFVLDAQARVIRVFDGRGTFLRSIGRPGPGPGELMSALGMGWDHQDRLWIAEAFSGRYSVFDSAGTFIKTVPRPMLGALRSQFRLVFDSDSSFIDHGLYLARVDTAGVLMDSFPALPQAERPRMPSPLPPSFDSSVLIYLPRTIWTLAPDGTLWFARSDQLRLIQRALNGDTLRIIETEHRDVVRAVPERPMVERKLAEIGVTRSDYRLIWPMVQAIHVLDDGHVLVQILDEVHRDGRVADVFDPSGRYLGTMDLGLRLNRRGIPALVGDTVVTVELGELDVPYVVRATIHR